MKTVFSLIYFLFCLSVLSISKQGTNNIPQKGDWFKYRMSINNSLILSSKSVEGKIQLHIILILRYTIDEENDSHYTFSWSSDSIKCSLEFSDPFGMTHSFVPIFFDTATVLQKFRKPGSFKVSKKEGFLIGVKQRQVGAPNMDLSILLTEKLPGEPAAIPFLYFAGANSINEEFEWIEQFADTNRRDGGVMITKGVLRNKFGLYTDTLNRTCMHGSIVSEDTRVSGVMKSPTPITLDGRIQIGADIYVDTANCILASSRVFSRSDVSGSISRLNSIRFSMVQSFANTMELVDVGSTTK